MYTGSLTSVSHRAFCSVAELLHSFQQVKTSLSPFPYSDRGGRGRGEDDLQESEFPVEASDVSPFFLSSDMFHSIS